jgi:hypothetical protein
MMTGFFGMNFGRGFAKWFFDPEPQTAWIHNLAITAVALVSVTAIAFGFWIVFMNWGDYRDILVHRTKQRKQGQLEGGSLKRPNPQSR